MTKCLLFSQAVHTHTHTHTHTVLMIRVAMKNHYQKKMVVTQSLYVCFVCVCVEHGKQQKKLTIMQLMKKKRQ